MFEEFNYLFKIVVIGDSGVGKTNLVSKFIDNVFHLDQKPTIGVEFSSKTINIDNKDIRCQIWDTAGQERFRAITKAYYNGAIGAIVVFDLTHSLTFQDITKWISQAQENTKQNTIILLVGNKSDLPNRQVSQTAINTFLQQSDNQILYMQTSALTGQNVNAAFYKLVENIYQKRKGQMDNFKSKPPRKEAALMSPMPSIEIIDNNTTKGEQPRNQPIVLKTQDAKNKRPSIQKSPLKKNKKCC